jgi:hypothetical protein
MFNFTSANSPVSYLTYSVLAALPPPPPTAPPAPIGFFFAVEAATVLYDFGTEPLGLSPGALTPNAPPDFYVPGAA